MTVSLEWELLGSLAYVTIVFRRQTQDKIVYNKSRKWFRSGVSSYESMI